MYSRALLGLFLLATACGGSPSEPTARLGMSPDISGNFELVLSDSLSCRQHDVYGRDIHFLVLITQSGESFQIVNVGVDRSQSGSARGTITGNAVSFTHNFRTEAQSTVAPNPRFRVDHIGTSSGVVSGRAISGRWQGVISITNTIGYQYECNANDHQFALTPR